MTAGPDVAGREQRLRQLELLVTRKLDGLLHGDYQGLVPAGGTEPGDGRPYSPGDDVRRMDWNLTARTNDPHVRTTIADRELETWLVIDTTASLDFGTAEMEKRDLVLTATAAFAFLTARHGNRLGAVLYGADGCRIMPPRTGRQTALALLHRLDERPRAQAGATTLADALRRTRLAARRRGLVVLVSDLLDHSAWDRELRALAHRNEVLVAEIRDPREDELPAVGLLTLVDPETGRRVDVQTSNPKLRARYKTAAAEQRASAAESVRKAGASHLILSTDRDWLRDVAAFVVAKRRRR